ncbi:MAG: hypothetical protein HC936_17340 [Leptolyngbyaceae cyanobacterium SU_3_3]|nr:hypothetical protein [Leptolyngbyaceae cyanobacterium SU_3_3]NJR49767.1 hypothetical protein [Leptolyngbyaceae cyanobacterium CSU_1_3]
MYDNKMRLSQDVLEKAEQIASQWGLKNSRAAIEAVFRKYADDYLYGRNSTINPAIVPFVPHQRVNAQSHSQINSANDHDALDELDDLLGL